MTNIEKEKMGRNMVISVLLAIAFAITTYCIYDGAMTSFQPGDYINFANMLAIVLGALGVVGIIVSLIMKKTYLVGYSIAMIVLAGLLELLIYGLISAPAIVVAGMNIPLGKLLFYGYEALSGLYIIFIALFTFAKITRKN